MLSEAIHESNNDRKEKELEEINIDTLIDQVPGELIYLLRELLIKPR